ncbi:hypothetical protein BLOT_001467 [Blomia tropicalis]|nr:hypothetical protein BLOT_001467 [Blomia tropicalis]
MHSNSKLDYSLSANLQTNLYSNARIGSLLGAIIYSFHYNNRTTPSHLIMASLTLIRRLHAILVDVMHERRRLGRRHHSLKMFNNRSSCVMNYISK